MLDGFEEFLFQSFMRAIMLTVRLIWALLRPIVPDLLHGLVSLLTYPVSWPVILVVVLWVFTDHSLAPSLVALAALVAVFAAVLLRPGLR